MDIGYAECQNCNTIHYVITEQEAKAIQRSGVLVDEFSDRNLECCINCGSKDKFSLLSEVDVTVKLTSDTVPPLLLRNEKIIESTTKEPESKPE